MAALRGARLEHVRVGSDPLPDLGAVDGLVVFGGAESVTEIDGYPALQEEAELLRAAVER
jgi:GMP synthase-like glutamine amidotransferase